MALPGEPTNPSRSEYDRRVVDACLRVLGTLVKATDSQERPRLVVVGGLAPLLLLPESRQDLVVREDPHPGTNDVDLCIQLDVAEDEELYIVLEQALEELGFVPGPRNDGRGESVWQWVRDVDDSRIAVEFLAPADSVGGDGAGARNGPPIGRIAEDEPTRPGDEIGALRVRAGELALRDAVPATIDIELLGRPDGVPAGLALVRVWVANLLPMLVLKGFALKNRLKDKDAFDIVWLLRHWPDGPVGAARAARASVVADSPHVGDAFAILRECFASHDREGCVRYATFELGPRPTVPREDRLRLARDAQGTVARFLQAWDTLADATPAPARDAGAQGA